MAGCSYGSDGGHAWQKGDDAVTVRTFPATVTSVRDGDSVRILADLGFRLFEDVHVRLAGMNAAELATDAGKAARDHLAQLAPHGTECTFICYGPDKYGGRWQGTVVTAAGVSLSRQMIADGYAAVWDGKGKAPVPPWPVPTAPTSP